MECTTDDINELGPKHFRSEIHGTKSMHVESSPGTIDANGLERRTSRSAEVWEDNQGAIVLASSVGYNARTKHVDIRHHFIRANVVDKTISVKHIKTDDQVADMLTKALGTKRLQSRAKQVESKSQAHHNSGEWDSWQVTPYVCIFAFLIGY